MFYIDLEETTVEKLEERIQELKEELKPRGDVYEVEPLYNSFELRLEEYSLNTNREIDPEIVDFAKQDLEESLTPAVLEATNGIDEILGWIFTIELAYIIVENERDKIEALSDEDYKVNVGKRGLMQAMNYLFQTKEPTDSSRFSLAFEELKVYIPQHESNKGAGCMILFSSLSALSSAALYF